VRTGQWRGAGRWLVWLLPVFALSALTWWLIAGQSRGAEIATDVAVPVGVISAAAALWAALRPDKTRSRREDLPSPSGSVADGVRAADADAHFLGVHPARLAGSPHVPQQLTPYLSRQHDIELREAILDAASGRSSVLALLTGDSATGKTRALVEALRAVIPGRQVRWPHDTSDLCQMLADGQIDGETVLWLNETQKYFYGEMGGRAAGALGDLLASGPGIIAVGAIWTRPYLRELTALGQVPDLHADVRGLLEGPCARRFIVPSSLDRDQREAMTELAKQDKRLSAALAAGAKDGRVIQHLSGGPELVEEYLHGSLFDPVEHALITAALDARRLGYEAPIPESLLTAAAEGYLDPSDRPRGGKDSWAAGLAAIAKGLRADDTRTDVRNTLTALTTYHLAAPDDVTCYEIDGYLDQQTRSQRKDIDGAPQLWDAFIAQVNDAGDLYRLGSAAHRKGLTGSAAQLLRKAVQLGHPESPRRVRRLDLLGECPVWDEQRRTTPVSCGTAL
jgi:hypothetical protein